MKTISEMTQDEVALLKRGIVDWQAERVARGLPPNIRYVVRGLLNESLILCTDGEFHAASLVGPGGWSAKIYKTRAGAEKSWPGHKIDLL